MTSLNDVKWKEFNFIDIFDIKCGFYNKKPPKETNGTIPFIGATDSNNGLTQFYSLNNIKNTPKADGMPNESIEKKLFDGNCICVTNNGSVGYAYYQVSSFTCTHDVNPLYLKNYKLTKNIAIFLISAIEKQRVCFAYARKWRPCRMKKSKILLPISKDNSPDWQYMENQIKNKEYELKDKYSKYIETRLKNIKKFSEEEKEWKEFKITDLFEIIKGNQNNMSSLKEGNLPLVSAKKFDNGYKAFVSPNNKNLFPENCLTLNNDGDGGAGISYYQPAKMLLDSHVTALIPKFKTANKYSLLYMSAAITKQKDKFGHGYSLNNARLSVFRFMLPVNKLGNPDYEYMENYMKYLEQQKLLKYIQYRN